MNFQTIDTRKKLLFSVLISGLLFGSCQRISNQVPPFVNKTVETIRTKYAPDKRLELFDIQIHKKGDQLFLAGETTNQQLKGMLLDSLSVKTTYYDIIDSIKVLPDPSLGQATYGIVYVSVANMRRTPKHSAELVNQSLLGTVLKLFKKEQGFYFAQNRDRYLGWVSSSSMIEVDSSQADNWLKSHHVIFISNYGVMKESPYKFAKTIVDLVPGDILRKIGETGRFVKVATPDGRSGFVEKNMVMEEKKFDQIVPKRSKIIETALNFLGVPYLWGGTSTKGFDCSGFVQNVFFLNHYNLPRDANQMVLEGKKIEADEDFSNIMPGDLLFFGPSENRITHVAISLGDQNFIHSDGWVHINSFDQTKENYNDYRKRTFRTIRRIISN